jgi:hypothetical protein
VKEDPVEVGLDLPIEEGLSHGPSVCRSNGYSTAPMPNAASG